MALWGIDNDGNSFVAVSYASKVLVHEIIQGFFKCYFVIVWKVVKSDYWTVKNCDVWSQDLDSFAFGLIVSIGSNSIDERLEITKSLIKYLEYRER